MEHSTTPLAITERITALHLGRKLGVACSVSFTSSWKGHEEEEFFVQLLKAESANSVEIALDEKCLFPMESNIDFTGITGN